MNRKLLSILCFAWVLGLVSSATLNHESEITLGSGKLKELIGHKTEGITVPVNETISIDPPKCGTPQDKFPTKQVLGQVSRLMGLYPKFTLVGQILGLLSGFLGTANMFDEMKKYADCAIGKAIDQHERETLDDLMKGYQKMLSNIHQMHPSDDIDMYGDDVYNLFADMVCIGPWTSHSELFMSDHNPEVAIEFFRTWVTTHLGVGAEYIRLTDNAYAKRMWMLVYTDYMCRGPKLIDDVVDYRLPFIKQTLCDYHTGSWPRPFIKFKWEDSYIDQSWSDRDAFWCAPFGNCCCDQCKSMHASCEPNCCCRGRATMQSYKQAVESDLRNNYEMPFDQWKLMCEELNKFDLLGSDISCSVPPDTCSANHG